MWHVRGRDPLWLALLAAVRRAYWWNPLVAYLARAGLLMLESICDHRSAKHFGQSRYVTELASLLLADAVPAPRLLATMQAASLNVERVRLLRTPLRLRSRDLVVVAALGVSAAATAMTNVVEPTHPASSMTPQLSALAPSTPTGNARVVLPHTDDADDSEAIDDMLASYAPQQHVGELVQ
jgi:beta-lactamase regulating signal transducer with metallopeptidase domain